MHSRISLMDSDGAAGNSEMHAPHGYGESARFAPYKRLHRRLRGRYALLIPLALIAFGIGSYYGWHKTVPVYRAEGMLHVANSLPQVMSETDQNEPLQMYEEFVDSQLLLMSSRHVVLVAMDDPKFRAVLGQRIMTVEQFVAALTTDHPPRTQAIDVTFTDPDPDVAGQAVKAVMAAFLDSYGKSDTSEEGRRLEVLAQRKQSLEEQIAALKKQIAAVPAPDALSVAMIDETMRDLLRQKATLENDQDHLLNPDVKKRVTKLDTQIDKYCVEFGAMQAAQAASPATKRNMVTLPEYLDFEEKMDGLLADKAETAHRIDVLNTEASLHTGRFTVASAGDTPSAPYADRRARMAAVFGLGAAMLPIGLFLLLGVADRRLHFSEDTNETSEIPLLGVLPVLSERKHDADVARVAAYCVHKLRVRLQMLGRNKERPVYMITSAVAGEGKTSLTLALGMAFATSGKRTLLIDADPIGRGLSRRLQQDTAPGLLDCFDGAGLSLVKPLAHNVSVLPAGQGEERRVDTGFGWEELEWLLNEGPLRYDVILIDTGPLLSSLQAPIVAQVADHVIMTVASGLKETLAKQSFRLMRSLDIAVAGVVFNRASSRDYTRWIGGESYYNNASSAPPNRHLNGSSPFGPLAATMRSPAPDRAEQGSE